MDTITVATFNKAADAQPLKQRLEDSHITAEIHDESVMERLWFVARPLAGVKVQVHARDHDAAMRLMHEWAGQPEVKGRAVICPECGSSRIEYPQFTRKFLIPNLLGLVAAAGLIEKEFYCQDCHCTWPREGLKKSRTRPHMAPNYFIEGIVQASPGTGSKETTH
jgi:hypothetical protein